MQFVPLSAHRPRERRSRALVLVGLALALGVSCDERSEVPTALVVAPADLEQYVTPDVAARLRNGQFTFDKAAAPSDLSIVSEEHAGRLARAYIRTFGRFMREPWEEQHGAPIDLSVLEVARIYYADTPYERLPVEAHPGYRNAFGPFYLVTLTQGGVPTLMVAVSGYSTDVGIDDVGMLVLPMYQGSNFWGQGISLNGSRFHPLAPEQAVTLVAGATGARVARVPELVLQNVDHAPVTAVWKLTLDRPAPVRAANSGDVQLSRFFVAAENEHELYAAADQQPSAVTVPLLMKGEQVRVVETQVRIRPGHAVAFETITPDERR
jgi:hypothetical protein